LIRQGFRRQPEKGHFIEGEAPAALPLEGATLAPVIAEKRGKKEAD
jgi:hypothetical protein